MNSTALLDAFSGSRRFIVYRTEPLADGKLDKIPTNPFNGDNLNAQDPTNWLDGQEALAYSEALELTRAAPVLSYGVGVMLYEGGNLFCIDLDKCRDESGGWFPHVRSFEDRFPGAYTETSISGNGRHIFGLVREPVKHSMKNKDYRMECYTSGRFIAVSGAHAMGNPLTELTPQFNEFAAQFFVPKADVESATWTDHPCAEWRGPADDTELLRRAMASGQDKATLFKGRKATFADFWNNTTGSNDESSVDQGLANHLAFWTGKDCERMLRLMWKAEALIRDKWHREDYLPRTIMTAVASQVDVYADKYSPVNNSTTSAQVVPSLPAAEMSVTLDLSMVPDPPNVGRSIPAAPALPPPPMGTVLTLKRGELPPIGKYVTIDQQQQIFDGMCYVTDIERIQLPSGKCLNKTQFSNIFAGRQWGITMEGVRPSEDAWNAFVRSEMWDFPKVHTQFFSPKHETGIIRARDGIKEINCYVPAVIARAAGDVSPFVTFVKTLLPNGNDAEILIYWMAAATRYIGHKFTWAPFIQGVKGNGKTTLGEIMEYCISPDYTHWAKPTEIAEKFNNVFSNKLLVIVDEAKTHDQAELQEILKLMVTAKRIEVRPMFAEKLMKDVCYNMMLISNYKNAVRIDADERRYAPFYCNQQKKAHNIRDGLDPQFFVKYFRPWLFEQGGLAVIYDYLMSVEIPEALDPSKACVIAPITSSTADAITASLGPIEQEILHAVRLGKVGFKGGWISSTAVDALLAQLGKDKFIPRNARAELVLALGYVPHQSLEDGLLALEVNNSTLSTVYIQRGHAWDVDYLEPAQVRQGYQEAQK